MSHSRVISNIVGRSVRRLAVGTLPLLALLSVAACTTAQIAGLTPVTLSAPVVERVGEGKTMIGLLSSLEPGNLSDGAVDSSHLAAKLAVSSLKNGLATLEIRPSGNSGNSARQSAEALIAAGVKIVIAADDETAAAAAARILGPKGVPTISLGAVGDTRAQLYGAGLDVRGEINAMVAELARRNYAHIVVAATPDATSKAYAAIVSKAALGNKIAVTSVPAGDPAGFLAGVQAARQKGGIDAIIFATGPGRATALAATVRADPALTGIGIVGNANWAMAEPLATALSGAWYPSLPPERLAQFVARFRTAYGANPTLASAIVYDLVIMAAVLPEAVPDTPYAPTVLRNEAGFDGFSGPFRFGSANSADVRAYQIVTAR